MKLSTRLGLAFLALVLLTIAVGGFALSRLAAVNANTVDIATSWLPSIKTLGDIRITANQIRRAEADHVMSTDPAETAAIDKRLDELRAQFADRQKTFEPLISSPEERASYEKFKQLRDRYLSAHTRLMDLSRGGEKTMVETKALFRGESRSAFNEMVAQQAELVAINDRGAGHAKDAAAATFSSAIFWTVAMIGLAIVVATGMALWIVRTLTAQLGGEPAAAAELARRVADGDLSGSIALRANDTTSLMAALKRMQDNLAGIVNGVRANAEGVASASGQISQGTTDLSSRTEEQA